MNRLEGKTALVSGGGSGIGRAIARRFAADGAQVLIVGRTEEPLRRTAESGGINYVVGDITQERTVEEIFETVRDKYGRLDILVNNAGWCPVQPVTELTIEDFDRAFNLDVRALVNMTIHALPLIRASHGSIINMSSVVPLISPCIRGPRRLWKTSPACGRWSSPVTACASTQ